jgi:hypothetical protein
MAASEREERCVYHAKNWMTERKNEGLNLTCPLFFIFFLPHHVTFTTLKIGFAFLSSFYFCFSVPFDYTILAFDFPRASIFAPQRKSLTGQKTKNTGADLDTHNPHARARENPVLSLRRRRGKTSKSVLF